MKNYRRSLIHLLFVTFFLLFVAWVAMKLMQHGGDPEALLREARREVQRWGRDIASAADKVAGFVKPLIEKVASAFRSLTKSLKAFFA